MSVQALTDVVKWYDEGSDAPATWYQSCEWNTDGVVWPTARSTTCVQPGGPVTVTGSASTSRDASSRSPAATPAGAATVVPSVTDDADLNAGSAAPVVSVWSAETERRPFASR